MTERPIIFSAESIEAMLAGRKTQTRRVMKPQFTTLFGFGVRNSDPNYFSANVNIKTKGGWLWVRCPYGQPSDTLWAREAWQECTECGRVNWRAGANDNGISCQHCDNFLGKWKSPIFMPRWASRIALRVADVRVERVQDISENDCIEEGIPSHYSNYSNEINMWSEKAKSYLRSSTYKGVFAQLWDLINAKRGHSWASNPWVWVVEFEVNQ